MSEVTVEIVDDPDLSGGKTLRMYPKGKKPADGVERHLDKPEIDLMRDVDLHSIWYILMQELRNKLSEDKDVIDENRTN